MDSNSANVEKEQTLAKCVDVFQFLLEALPTTINELHILLLYARSLELSASPGLRFRANGVYQILLEYCQQQSPPIALADAYSNGKVLGGGGGGGDFISMCA